MKIRIKNYFVIVAALFVLSACNQSPIRIACVGDSITEGAGIKFQNVNAYPAYLDSLLGDDYCVLNSGKGGTTLQSEGDFSYWNTKEFSNMFNFEPDIVILKLGTNDTKPQNWNEERFSADYQLLIDTILTMKNRPEIIICKPVPVFATRWGINDSILVNGVIPTIEKIALKIERYNKKLELMLSVQFFDDDKNKINLLSDIDTKSSSYFIIKFLDGEIKIPAKNII